MCDYFIDFKDKTYFDSSPNFQLMQKIRDSYFSKEVPFYDIFMKYIKDYPTLKYNILDFKFKTNPYSGKDAFDFLYKIKEALPEFVTQLTQEDKNLYIPHNKFKGWIFLPKIVGNKYHYWIIGQALRELLVGGKINNKYKSPYFNCLYANCSDFTQMGVIRYFEKNNFNVDSQEVEFSLVTLYEA
jgi:hypothetical protein